MKISFITTIFNEEKTIGVFLDSLFSQSRLPDEVIIVDGGSTDASVEKVKIYGSKIKKKKVRFEVSIKHGNRSVGRNEAIKNTTGDIIVCSDSGNILDKDWIKNITKPFKDNSINVVAGYYKAKPRNIFQKCLLPFVFVMPDKVDPDNFLPATRSVAFTKKMWKKVGGFDERFSHNEDYVFANKLKEMKAKIVFAKDAIVYWLPRNTFKEAFVMFFRFAFGDAESGMWRTNVQLLFARYFLGLYFIFLSFLYRSLVPIGIVLLFFILYVIWSIKKNFKYVKHKKAYVILPLLQFTADFAVLSGTTCGLLKKLRTINYYVAIKQHAFLFTIITFYVFITLFTLQWGIPNQNHPFPYHMDEWHQLQAVANTFRYGTPNTAGSANGTMLHFLLSGFYLIPFMALKIINPFALSITNLIMREKVFEVLRINTIMWGVLSIIAIYNISGLLTTSKKLAIFFFTFSPIWLMLSGYFKYDIGLMFWLVLSLYFFLRFAKNSRNENFLIAAIPAGLAVAVKISAFPLLLLYIFSYFWFNPLWKNSWKYLFAGLVVFVSCVILFGMPDTVFGKGNILVYLYQNLIQSQGAASNFILPTNTYSYLFITLYPLLFGNGVFILFLISCVFWLITFLKSGVNTFKVEVFMWISAIVFLASIASIQIFGSGNRSLVMLPFLVLLIVLTWKEVQKYSLKNLFVVVLCFAILAQVYESLAWVNIRLHKSPQETSSEWIIKNIPKGTMIGIENIPVYQNLPNIIEEEFYLKQYTGENTSLYRYQLVEYKSKSLPSTVVVTSDAIERLVVKQSVKNDLTERLDKEGYKKIATFEAIKPFSKLKDTDFYFTWLVAAPLSTTIYQK